jgi:hypothetical protein
LALKKLIPDASEPANFGKPYAFILIRLFAGIGMFFAGIEKATNPWWNSNHLAFSAAGYLTHVAGGGIFHPWFVSLAGASTIGAVNFLVVAGEIGIGLAFILGVIIRLAAILGTIEIGLIWMTEYLAIQSNGKPASGPFNAGWATGPLELGAALVAMFIVSALLGGGLIFGIDGWIEKSGFIKKHPKLKILLG